MACGARSWGRVGVRKAPSLSFERRVTKSSSFETRRARVGESMIDVGIGKAAATPDGELALRPPISDSALGQGS